MKKWFGIIGGILILLGLARCMPHALMGDMDGGMRSLTSMRSLIFIVPGFILLIVSFAVGKK